MKQNEPPLEIFSESEVFNLYWRKEDSIRSNLEKNLKQLNARFEFSLLPQNVINEVKFSYDLVSLRNSYNVLQSFYSGSGNGECENLSENDKIREIFKLISKKMKYCSEFDKSKKFIFYEGLSDMLFLYRSTKTYFKTNSSYKALSQSPLK